MADETRLARLAQQAADVQLSVEVNPGQVQVLELVVANVGRATAQDVHVHIEPDALKSRGFIKDRTTNLIFSTLLPGAQHRLYLNVAAMMGTDVIKAQVEFRDSSGKHLIPLEQQMSGLLGYMRGGDDPAYTTARALENLTEAVKSVIHNHRVMTDVFSQGDRDGERKKRENWMAEIAKQESE